MEGNTTNWRNVHAISLCTFTDTLQFSFYMWSFWPYLQQPYNIPFPFAYRIHSSLIDPSIGTMFVGIIMAISGVGEALAAPIFGYWANRIGRIRPPVYTSLAMSGVGNVLYLFLVSFSLDVAPYVIVLSRFLSGTGSGNRGCFRALVACNSMGGDRAKALASSGGAALVGLTIGPAVQLVFNFIGPPGVRIGPLVVSQYTAPALLAIAINVATALLFHFAIDDSLQVPSKSDAISDIAEDSSESEGSFREDSFLHRMDVIAVVICMGTRSIRMLATSNIESIGAPFTEIMFNFTHAQALEWNSVDQFIVGGLTVAVFMLYALTNYTKWVSERSNCLSAIVGLFCFYCITMPWPFLPGSVDCSRFIGDGTHNWRWCETLPPINQWLYYSSYAVIYGICLPMLNNSLQALYSRVLGHGPQGAMQGMNQAVGSIARIFGPLIMSSTFSRLGPQATWTVNIVLLAIVIGIWIAAYERLVPLELRNNENRDTSKSCSPRSSNTQIST